MDRPRWPDNPSEPDERRKAPPRRWPALPPEPLQKGFAVRRDWPDGTHTFVGFSHTADQAQRRLAGDRDYWQRGPLRPAGWSIVEITRYQMNTHYNQTDCRSPACPTGIPTETPSAGRLTAPPETTEQQEPAITAGGRSWSPRALLRRLIGRHLPRLADNVRAFWQPPPQAGPHTHPTDKP
ncbi:hypothetical protein [Polymorphospora sp. NPDC050346]|uniref:hypothetical protein n=1 Tax=Polymorphospora sp. NPDC050346 TaxID=3155780 RepID=UPI0033C34321